MSQKNVLKDFKQFQPVSVEIINKYENKIPSELLNIWKKFGFGSFQNGYLKIINPDDYMELLNNSYFNAKSAIPIMITAFGDILIWENDQYLTIVRYRYGDFKIAISGFDLFFDVLEDSTFLKRNFQLEFYEKCVSTYGVPDYTQCFGCVPLQRLGGKEKLENFKTVKAKEHIALMIDILGGI